MIKNESNIIKLVLNGNASSYKILVDAYKDLVFTLVKKIVKNHEEAEEVTQDTFLKAYHALPNFKMESKFSTWLFRIAYNSAISKTRKKSITTSSIDDFVIENYSVDDIQSTLDQIDENERIRILNDAIFSLNGDEQLLINLFYYNEQSIEEICEITGLSESNVKVKLYRTRKKLYEMINQRIKKSGVITD